MEKDNNKTAASFFIVIILLLYFQMVVLPYFTQKPAPPTQGASTVAGTPTQSPTAPPVTAEDLALLYPSDLSVAEAGHLQLRSDDLQVELALLGGRFTHLLLPHHLAANDPSSPPVDLVEHAENFPLPMGLWVGEKNDSHVAYRIRSIDGVQKADEQSAMVILPADKAHIVLEGQWDGATVTKTVTIPGKGYEVEFSYEVAGAEGKSVQVEWTRRIPHNAPTLLDPYNVGEFVWFDGAKANRKKFLEISKEVPLDTVEWVALGDKYFIAALVATDSDHHTGSVYHDGDLYRARLSGKNASTFRLFVGPKSYTLLKEAGNRLELSIAFGVTGFVAVWLLPFLHGLHQIFANYGLAVIALTILVRLAMYPINAMALRQMRAMQQLQPDIQRIRETVTDPQQQQKELMALYKGKNVNPFGGCLPMVLQFFVFIGLYTSILTAVELRHAPFGLWIRDLSQPARYPIFGVQVPVLELIFIALLAVQQLTTPSNLERSQKIMMTAMTVVFGFFLMGMPSGLVLYTLTSAFVSVAQQLAVQRVKRVHPFIATVGMSVFIFAIALLVAHS